MARPRTHDVDSLLDAAERLLAHQGAPALTIRALAEATGASSGSLYHAFGSRADLLARMWLRAAERFLAMQEAALDEELGTGNDQAAVEATVAVASVPAAIRKEWPDTATVLLRYRRDDILTLMFFYVASVLAGNLAARLRSQVNAQRAIAKRTASLYEFSRKLASTASLDDVVWTAVSNVGAILQCQAVALTPGTGGRLEISGALAPNTLRTASISFRSPTGVEVPCGLR